MRNSKNSEVVTEYADYLTEVRGLSPRTAVEYSNTIKRFLRVEHRLTSLEKLAHWATFGKGGATGKTFFNTVCKFTYWRERTYGIENRYFEYKEYDLPAGKAAKVKHKLPERMSLKDINKVLKSGEDRQSEVIMYCLYMLGLRREELVALNINHFTDSTFEYVRIIGKGSKERHVPIQKGLLSRIVGWITDKLKDGCSIDDPVFTGPKGGRITSWQVWCYVKNAGEKAEVKIHPHSFRHAFATRLVENEMSIEKIATLLGHSNINTTWRYVHLTVSGKDIEAAWNG